MWTWKSVIALRGWDGDGQLQRLLEHEKMTLNLFLTKNKTKEAHVSFNLNSEQEEKLAITFLFQIRRKHRTEKQILLKKVMVKNNQQWFFHKLIQHQTTVGEKQNSQEKWKFTKSPSTQNKRWQVGDSDKRIP